jgi:hypothetical protein
MTTRAPLSPAIAAYHADQTHSDRDICDALASTIATGLPTAEGRIWHRHPVWFIDGNRIVGYSKLKHGIRLMFWSGQSFDEPALMPEPPGTAFKSALIQWDYKNQRSSWRSTPSANISIFIRTCMRWLPTVCLTARAGFM